MRPRWPSADLANLQHDLLRRRADVCRRSGAALEIFGPRLYQLYGQGESPMTIAGLSQRLHADSDHPRWRERLGSCGYAAQRGAGPGRR